MIWFFLTFFLLLLSNHQQTTLVVLTTELITHAMHLHVERLPQLQKKFIVLASASPRRADLLRQIGISNFKVVVSDFEEDLPHAQFWCV